MSHTDDDSDIPGDATIDDVDALDLFLDRLLAGADPAADAPAWSRDVAHLVRAAQAPAQPGELAGENDIVSRMVEVRRLAADRAAPALARTGTGGHAATDAGRSPTGESAAGTGVLASVTHLADRRGRDRSDRHYRAKHAAARLEASRHPALRTVGRMLAMKAAAVTTVAVVGVAAAAAATTGIVATVVVPAFTDEPPEPKPAPTTEGRRRTSTTGGTRAPDADRQAPASCTPDRDCPAPPSTAATPTTTTSTTHPSPTTTEAARGDTAPSTTTTVPTSTTSTTVGTQTTVESTTTTTGAPGPGPDPAVSTFIDDGSGDAGGGSTP
ncbi:MAG TPA: hypothetical protein VFY82_10465 [Acidimicrobiales bacterium]|nr:hypothetical protein [Acidimicrobiales bacterium]